MFVLFFPVQPLFLRWLSVTKYQLKSTWHVKPWKSFGGVAFICSGSAPETESLVKLINSFVFYCHSSLCLLHITCCYWAADFSPVFFPVTYDSVCCIERFQTTKYYLVPSEVKKLLLWAFSHRVFVVEKRAHLETAGGNLYVNVTWL